MEKKLSPLNTIAIMSAFVFGCGIMIINPVIQKLIEAYPDVSVPTIKMASTLPSLMSSFIMIFVGSIVGKKVKYKSVLTLAMICFLVGGMLPIVWNQHFWNVLVARAIFGFGMGFIGCRNSLVIASYDDTQKAKFLGYGVFVANAFGVMLQIICGYMADVSLKFSFYIYLVAVVPLLLITFGLKEPESASAPSASVQSDAPKVKKKLRGEVYLYIFIGFIWCVLGYSIMTNMASFIKMKELGDAGVSGTILSLYTLGGAVAGAVSSKLYGKLKRMLVPVCFATAALGEALVLIGLNIPMIAVGTALAGFGWFVLFPNVIYFSGVAAGKESQALVTSIVMAATQIGVFGSSYFCYFLGTLNGGNSIIAAKYAAIIGFGALAVFTLIKDIRPHELKEK